MHHQRLEFQDVVSRGGDEIFDPASLSSGTGANRIHERQSSDEAVSPFGWLAEPADIQEPNVLDNLLRIHEYERQRLGQELHDSAGQLLVALQLSVAHLRTVEPNSAHGNLLDEINDTVRQIDREIRALAFLHYPMELGSRGLCCSVQALVRGFESRTGIRTSFNCVCDTDELSENVAMALLRVSQEALVNIHRHSRATSARVLIRKHADLVELIITDNGIGIPPEMLLHARGIGLQGMKHRMESLGGKFRVNNLKRGTRLHASVPQGGCA